MWHKMDTHDDVIKWKHFPRNWPFVRGIHWSPVNSPHKGQLRGALVFSLICAWKNDCVNNHEAGDLRRHRGHYDVTLMFMLVYELHDKCDIKWTPKPYITGPLICKSVLALLGTNFSIKCNIKTLSSLALLNLERYALMKIKLNQAVGQ